MPTLVQSKFVESEVQLASPGSWSLLEGDGSEALDELSSVHVTRQLAGHDRVFLEEGVQGGSAFNRYTFCLVISPNFFIFVFRLQLSRSGFVSKMLKIKKKLYCLKS